MAARRDKMLRDAEKLAQKGKADLAIQEYEKVLKAYPTDVNTINKVGDLYLRVGRVDRAIELYERIADHFSQDGFATKAIAILKKINRLAPQRLDIFDRLADLYIQQGLVVEAKNQYQILADWYAKKGDHRRAVEIHRKLVQLDPANHMAHLRLADMLFQLREVDQAIEVYDRLGRVLLERGKLDEAERLYRHALEQNPPQGDFVVPLCEALLGAGRTASARELVDAAFRRSPDSFGLQSIKVRTYLTFGEADQALALARRAVQARPDSSAAQTLLGRALLLGGRHAEARETLLPAGEELLRRGEFSEVRTLADALAEVFPDDLQVLGLAVRAYRHTADRGALLALIGRLADLSYRAGKHDHADRLYMELLTADPGNNVARRRIAEIRKVEPHQVVVAESAKPQELADAVEVEPGELGVSAGGSSFDPEERLGEARVFAKYGLLDKASAHLEEILRHFPNHVDSRQALVDVLVDRGEGQAAVAVARPLYEAYRRAGDEVALATLAALVPALVRHTPAPAPRREAYDDEVIVLDLDEPAEATGFEVKAAIAGPAAGGLVFDLDELERAIGEDKRHEPAVGPPPAVRPAPKSRAKAKAAPPKAGLLADALDQLDSFIEHDLHEDALRLLGRLERDHPDDADVAERRRALKAKGVLLEEVVAAPAGGGPEELFADEEESFIDLAKELEMELAEEEAMVEEATGRGKEEAILEEVFREFQKGVQEQLSEEDSDTHFNLGIAYKEMGLLPEAIREFQVASRDHGLFVECCSMVGMCFMEQGMWGQAADWYQKALGAPNLTPEAQLALRYDLAASLESAGDVDLAVCLYQEVVAVGPDYRGVSTRLDALSGGQ
jgi:tetratricopeptide (TPR) repeat protein